MKTTAQKSGNLVLRNIMCLVAVLIVISTTTTLATGKKPAAKTMIINANVFNGKSEKLAEGMSVLIGSNKITKMAKSIDALAGATTIDAGGRTLT